MSSQPGKAKQSLHERRRRRHPRYRTNFPVAVKLLAGENYQRLEGHCKDLSRAGIGILIAAELSHGEVVSLNFSLPGSAQSQELRAVLRHRRGYHYGFEFLSLSRDQEENLVQFVSGLERAD